jgi:hypothetical protein
MGKIAEMFKEGEMKLYDEHVIDEIPMTGTQRFNVLDSLSDTITAIYKCVPKEAWDKFEKNLKKTMRDE